MRIFYLGNPKYTAIRTNTIPSVIRIIDHPLCFLRDNPMTIKNIPSSIDAIIAKNPILFTPIKFGICPASTRTWAENFRPRRECVRKSSGALDGADAVSNLLLTFPGWTFKMNHSIMEIGYFQIMSDSDNSSVKFFVHFKKQGYNSFSVLHIQRRRRLVS